MLKEKPSYALLYHPWTSFVPPCCVHAPWSYGKQACEVMYYHTLAKFHSNALESITNSPHWEPRCYIYTRQVHSLRALVHSSPWLMPCSSSRGDILTTSLFFSPYKQWFYACSLESDLKGLIAPQPLKNTVYKCNNLKDEAIVPGLTVYWTSTPQNLVLTLKSCTAMKCSCYLRVSRRA